MNLIDLLQCDSCKENLEEFLKLNPELEEDVVKVIEHYTIFCEMRRLKEKATEKGFSPKDLFPSVPDPSDWTRKKVFDNPLDPYSRPTITC